MKAALTQVHSLYQQWESITTAEALAIADGRWPEVAQCHAAKELLQAEIARLAPPIEQLEQRDPVLQRLIGRLIAREKANQSVLSDRIQASVSQQDRCQAASHQLRRIGLAYGARHNARWQSYS